MVASLRKQKIMHEALCAIDREAIITDEDFKMATRILEGGRWYQKYKQLWIRLNEAAVDEAVDAEEFKKMADGWVITIVRACKKIKEFKERRKEK